MNTLFAVNLVLISLDLLLIKIWQYRTKKILDSIIKELEEGGISNEAEKDHN